MKPTKSAANIIANNSTAGLPVSTDLVLFAPLPNTPLVTPARHCTVAELIAGASGITGTIAVDQVAFGAGPNQIQGDAGFTFDRTSYLAMSGPIGELAVNAADLANDVSFVNIGSQAAPGDNGLNLLRINAQTVSDAAATYAVQTGALIQVIATQNGKTAETDGIAISVAGRTSVAGAFTSGIYMNVAQGNDSSGAGGDIRGLSINSVLDESGLLDEACGVFIGNVSGAGANFAIKTAAGLVSFGDDVRIANGKAIKTTTTTGHTLKIQGYDVDAAGYVDFVTITNSNTPTLAIAPPAGGGIVNIQATDYKSSDGTSGETAVIVAAGLVSITVKNGLVVAHA